MSRLLPLICLLVAAAKAGEVFFQDCGSAYALLSVDIDACKDPEEPCPMSLGQLINVTITFKAGFRSESLRPDVYFTLVGVIRDAEVQPQDCHALLSTTCPIASAEQNITYQAQAKVEEDFVPARGDLTWRLLSETGIQLVCMNTMVHLYAPEPF